MLLSGSKSYYDDYLRKKDTSRTLHDPPSLLTDRGAYVNFLEVQLERVSAACLGVQGYDQRFNDMQEQIISLEQKHSSTTRLLALNQQCTEELRKIVDEKILRVTEEMRSENWNFRQLLESISSRIAGVEYLLSEKVPALQRELNEATETIAENQTEMRNLKQILESNFEESQSQIESIRENASEVMRCIAKLETADSKLQFEMEETTTKLRQTIQSSEKRLQESIQEHHDLQSRSVHSFSVKLSEQIDKVQVDVVSREAGCMAATRLLGDNLRDDLQKIQKEVGVEINEMEKRWTEELEDEMEKVRNRFMEHIVILSSGLDTQRVVQQTSTDNSKRQFHQFDQAISTISTDQDQLLRTTSQLKESVERVLSDSAPPSGENSPRLHPEAPPPQHQQQAQPQWEQEDELRWREQQGLSQGQQKGQRQKRYLWEEGSDEGRDPPRDERGKGATSAQCLSGEERQRQRGLPKVDFVRESHPNPRREEDQWEPSRHEASLRSHSSEGSGGLSGGTENVPPNPERRREGKRVLAFDKSLPQQQPSFEESPIPKMCKSGVSDPPHRGRLRTPVTISHSPERSSLQQQEATSRARSGGEEYIDYVGGGLYSDGSQNQGGSGLPEDEETSHKRALALGLTYIGSGLYVADPRGLPSSTSSSSEKPRGQSPSRRAPLPPPSSKGSEEMVAAFERFLSKYRSAGQDRSPPPPPLTVDPDPPPLPPALLSLSLEEQFQQQDSLTSAAESHSLSWSDFLEGQDQQQAAAKRSAMSEYAKFQQQQQLLPWRPTSNLAQPLSRSQSPPCAEEPRRESPPCRPPLSPLPTLSYRPPDLCSLPDSSTISSSLPQQGPGAGREEGAGRVDKIAPERRHYVPPATRLVGSSAMLK
jgi:hypothetical protein